MTYSKSNSGRPISFLSISHPTGKIETELSILKSWESTSLHGPNAEVICNGLFRLVEVYSCMDELLSLPETGQSLSKHKEEKWVDGLLEAPIMLLDICSNIRELVSEVKEIVRDFQYSFRRKKGELSIEANVAKLDSLRKKMRKRIKSFLTSLNQIDKAIDGTEILGVADNHLSSIIRVVREVNVRNVIVFRSVLVLLSASKAKRSKWSVSRMIRKGTVACESQETNSNVLERLDYAVSRYSETSQCLQIGLENMEASFNSIETGLDNIFRCLINSRISLLNVVSSSFDQ